MIKSWDHQNVAYNRNDVHEFSMALGFEAVSYDMGNVGDGTVEGFGQTHYDQTPSTLHGNSSGTNASPSLIAQNVTTNSVSTLTNIVNTVNGYQNTQNLNNTTGILTNINSNAVSISGLQGTAFPVNTTATTTTTATPVNL